MLVLARFLALVVLLNVARYLVAAPIEAVTIMPVHDRILSANSAVFRAEFDGTDWAASFAYNFVLWLVTALVFRLTYRSFTGSWITRSMKVWGLMLMLHLSLLAVVMNHYQQREIFAVFMLSGVIAYPIVAVANGLLFPRLLSSSLERGPVGAPVPRIVERGLGLGPDSTP